MWIPTKLSSLIEPVAKAALGKDWSLFSGLLQNWPEIVGKAYAAETTPVKITFPTPPQNVPQQSRRTGGMLTIRLPKGLAMSFTYDIPAILQRVNTYFGYQAIAKIVLDPVHKLPQKRKTAASPSKEILTEMTEKTSSIEDTELRDALKRLGASILAESKNSAGKQD